MVLHLCIQGKYQTTIQESDLKIRREAVGKVKPIYMYVCGTSTPVQYITSQQIDSILPTLLPDCAFPRRLLYRHAVQVPYNTLTFPFRAPPQTHTYMRCYLWARVDFASTSISYLYVKKNYKLNIKFLKNLCNNYLLLIIIIKVLYIL